MKRITSLAAVAIAGCTQLPATPQGAVHQARYERATLENSTSEVDRAVIRQCESTPTPRGWSMDEPFAKAMRDRLTGEVRCVVG